MKECFCIGPKDGQPLCPCRMRNVQIKDGRYVEMIDHGPVRDGLVPDFWEQIRSDPTGCF